MPARRRNPDRPENEPAGSVPPGERIVLDREDLSDNLPGAGIPQAHNVDRQKKLVRLGLRKRRRVRRNRKLNKVTCPYCLTAFVAGDQVVRCPACRLPHHVECWMENEGCCSYGCEVAPLRTLAPSPATEPVAAPVPASEAVVPTGPIVCTCGNPLGADAGYCLVCGRSRHEMRGPGRRPAVPPRVPHALIRSTVSAAALGFLLALGSGILIGASLSHMAFKGFTLAAPVLGYCLYFFFKAVRDAVTMLRDLRDRPFEYGRGTAIAVLALCVLALYAAWGLGWLALRFFSG